MFLLLLLPLVVIGYVAYRVVHHRLQPAGIPGAPSVVVAAFWPTSLEGRLAVGAFALGLFLTAVVNANQVPFLSWIVLVAALLLAGVARLVRHDNSVSVLVMLLVTTLATVAGLLFLGGEVLIGHD